jgi:uncharacterized protein
MPTAVTASMLYDLVMCPHRVTMDLYADPGLRDEPNPFVKMLWERGSLYEREVIGGLDIPVLDLSGYSGDDQERLTLEAMQRGEPLIYSGRIKQDDLLGDPDLLRHEAGGYVAGDIKSGAGEEGPEDNSSPKEHYAVQLGLYTDILERKGLSPGRRAFVWDIHGDEVPYDFTALYGVRNPRTLWQDYEECVAEARAIIADPNRTRAAYSSACKFCHWYSACIENLVALDDLTLIPELGRPKRDVMLTHLQSVAELAECNPDGFYQWQKDRLPRHRPRYAEEIPHAGEAAEQRRRKAGSAYAGRAARRRPRTLFRHRGRSHARHLLPAWLHRAPRMRQRHGTLCRFLHA